MRVGSELRLFLRSELRLLLRQGSILEETQHIARVAHAGALAVANWSCMPYIRPYPYRVGRMVLDFLRVNGGVCVVYGPRPAEGKKEKLKE